MVSKKSPITTSQTLKTRALQIQQATNMSSKKTPNMTKKSQSNNNTKRFVPSNQTEWSKLKRDQTDLSLDLLKFESYLYDCLWLDQIVYNSTNFGQKYANHLAEQLEEHSTISVFRFLYISSFQPEIIKLSPPEISTIVLKNLMLLCRLVIFFGVEHATRQNRLPTGTFYFNKGFSLLHQKCIPVKDLLLFGDDPIFRAESNKIMKDLSTPEGFIPYSSNKVIHLLENYFKPFLKDLKSCTRSAVATQPSYMYSFFCITDFSKFDMNTQFNDNLLLEFIIRKYIFKDVNLPNIKFNKNNIRQFETLIADLNVLLDIRTFLGLFGSEDQRKTFLTNYCLTSNRFNLPYNKFISEQISNTSFSKLCNVLECLNRCVIFDLCIHISSNVVPNTDASSFVTSLLLKLRHTNESVLKVPEKALDTFKDGIVSITEHVLAAHVVAENQKDIADVTVVNDTTLPKTTSPEPEAPTFNPLVPSPTALDNQVPVKLSDNDLLVSSNDSTPITKV